MLHQVLHKRPSIKLKFILLGLDDPTLKVRIDEGLEDWRITAQPKQRLSSSFLASQRDYKVDPQR